jgi:hypothetical protein
MAYLYVRRRKTRFQSSRGIRRLELSIVFISFIFSRAGDWVFCRSAFPSVIFRSFTPDYGERSGPRVWQQLLGFVSSSQRESSPSAFLQLVVPRIFDSLRGLVSGFPCFSLYVAESLEAHRNPV